MKQDVDRRTTASARRGGIEAQTPIGDPDDDDWESDDVDDDEEEDDEDDEEEPLQATA
jgi:hypothetical protein